MNITTVDQATTLYGELRNPLQCTNSSMEVTGHWCMAASLAIPFQLVDPLNTTLV